MQTVAGYRANAGVILAMNAAWMALVVMPVMVPFYQSYGLSMSDVFRLQTLFALLVVVLEVPSGYVSDLLGRRGCLLVASVLHGAAFTALALADGFAGFAVVQVLAAMSASLWSGTDVAILYDSFEADAATGASSGPTTTSVLGQRLFWAQAGETAASLLGGALVLVHLRAPAVATAVIAWIPLLLALRLREPPRTRLSRTAHRDNLIVIARALFRDSRHVRWVLVHLIAYGVATLLAVWAFQGYWGALGVGLGWFGVLWAAYNLLVATTGRVAHRLEARFGVRPLLIVIALLPAVGYAGMAVCGVDAAAPWAMVGGIAFGLCFQVSRGLTQVVVRDRLNLAVAAAMRATANSVSSLGVRLAFAVLGPILGWLIDARGYPFAFGVFAALYLLVGIAVTVPLGRIVAESDG